jgi:NDP-4-keto-2,6-dideoxyhexose 3-C-methyltransferase
VQLGHRYDPAVLYGDQYGYRSGLNSSLVAHLRGKAERIKQRVALTSGELILRHWEQRRYLSRNFDRAGRNRLGDGPFGGKIP